MTSPSLQRLKTLNAKLLALQWLVGDFAAPSMPAYVAFNAAAVCNLQCPHCPSHGTPERRRAHNSPGLRMSPQLLRRIADETLPTAATFNLTLIGEPLATPGAAALLRDLTRLGAKLEMTTNGTLLSPEWIATLLPIARLLQFSVDGASPVVFERLRLGARYGHFLANAWLLGRTRELVADLYNPHLSLACVVMGSNVRELPLLVELASFLRLDAARFDGITVKFDSQKREALSWHKARYNHYRERAIARAIALGVEPHFYTPPFADVAADPAPTERDGLIVGDLPAEEYYERLPAFETFVDLPALETRASGLAGRLRNAHDVAAPIAGDGADGQFGPAAEAVHARLMALVSAHAPRLRQFGANPGEQIPNCVFVQERAFFGADGRMYACCYGTLPEIGSVLDRTVADHWNGPVRRYLAEAILRRDPHRVCRNCVQRRTLDARHFLDKVFTGPDSPPIPSD